MARQELHSDTLSIEQKSPIMDTSTHEGDIVIGERIESNDYLEALAFMEEPVRIRIEPTAEKNAAGAVPIWCNGKGAEIYQNGRWHEFAYLPVGHELVVRRKVLEILIRAKTDTVHTRIQDMDSERPNNVVERFTSPVASFTILEDNNPRGPAWVREIRRRNL